MENAYQLNVHARSDAGKGAARATRRAGLIPGVIYGHGMKPILISAIPNEIIKPLHMGVMSSSLYNITIDGGQTIKAICRGIQLHPINDMPMHVDFQFVKDEDVVNIWVPVRFKNRDVCAGIKLGGSLTVVRPQVELSCPTSHILDTLDIDLTDFKIGSSIKISAFDLPAGITPVIKDRDFVVATISIPRGMTAEEANADSDASTDSEE